MDMTDSKYPYGERASAFILGVRTLICTVNQLFQ